jgi:nitrogen fixation NifU-like protein
MEVPLAGQGETADFDAIVAILQRALSEQIEAVHSATVLKEARHPNNLGAMLEPDGHAVVLGACGDTMEMFLRIDGSRIEAATFGTDGCGPTVACGSMLTKMVQGMTLDQAGAVEAADLIIALHGLPAENVHCATLAVATLHKAIENHRSAGSAGEH